MDESKPHLHVDVVPLTEDGKLALNKLSGAWKDAPTPKQWLETMQEKCPDLISNAKRGDKRD